jgi:hypothetical protein
MRSSRPGAPATERPHRARAPVLATLTLSFAIPVYGSGRLLLVHLLFMAALPPVVIEALRRPFLRHLWMVALLWSAAELATDLTHGTRLLTQWTSSGPLVALLVSGLCFARRTMGLSVPDVALAAGVGWAGFAVLSGGGALRSNPWKYGLAEAVGVALLAQAQRRGWSRGQTCFLLVGLVAISLSFDSRLYCGVSALTALLLLFGKRARSQIAARRGLFALIAGCIVLGGYLGYPAAASAGVFGARAQVQQQQFGQTGTNFLLGNRLELLQAVSIVWQNGGHGIGSDADLPDAEVRRAFTFVQNYGRPLDVNDVDYLLGMRTPTAIGRTGYADHSMALDTAVHAGLLALPFWFFFFRNVLSGVIRTVGDVSRAPALLLWTGLSAIWDLLFSPMTPGSLLGASLALFLLAVDAEDSRL